MPAPTLPGPRLAYDADGTFGFVSRNTGADRSPLDLHPDALTAMNADANGGLALNGTWWSFTDTSQARYVILSFPQPVVLDAWMASAVSTWSSGGSSPTRSYEPLDMEFQVSHDTTNGLDGTWIPLGFRLYTDQQLPSARGSGSGGGTPSSVDPTGASSNTTSAVTTDLVMWKDAAATGIGWQEAFSPHRFNVRGFRIFFPRKPPGSQSGWAGTAINLHLYGKIDEDAATGDWLSIVDDVTDDPFDSTIGWGDVPRTFSDTKTIRVRNHSAAATAEDVTISVEASVPTEPISSTEGIRLSLDGSTWAESLNLGDIAPGDDSADVFVRLEPQDGMLGYRWARIFSEAGSWA